MKYIERHPYVVLSICALVLFLAANSFLAITDSAESNYALTAKEMVLSGDYITPHFDYMPYFEKPIFQYWITALSMELFGFKEFTGRILPALTGLGNVFLAFWLGRTMYGDARGSSPPSS